MPPRPVSSTNRLHSREDAHAALRVAEEVVTRQGGRIDQRGPNTLVASFGSRRAYRLLGVFGPGGRQLPMQLRLQVGPGDEGAVADVEMTSDEGWYLVRISRAERAYRDRFDHLLAALREAGLASV
jgi:hypothetical protein